MLGAEAVYEPFLFYLNP